MEPTIIIDNFFDNPYKIRNYALENLYHQHESILNDTGKNYPGIRCNLSQDIYSFLRKNVEKIINKRFERFDASFHLTSREHQLGLIHKDGLNIAGLIYLNEDAPQGSGTILCEPRDIENQPFLDTYMQKQFNEASSTQDIDIIENFANFKKEYNTKNYKIHLNVENKFNRLLIYKGTSYHAPYNYFGNNIFNSRLVVVFWGC